MKQIANLAGISKGGIYLYFENKEEVFRAAIDYVGEKHRSEILHAIHNENSATVKLYKIITAHFAFLKNQKQLVFFMMGDGSGPPHIFREKIFEEREKFLHLIKEVLEEGMEQSEFRYTDIEVAAKVFFGGLVAVSGDLLFMDEKQEFNQEETERKILDMFLQGLKKSEGGA